ncbi:MAG: hypothetical protein Q8941_20475 [Bacteroidota bacterium]|nr:hypothetical protein [Bacteroidota bacterium]
MTTETLYWKCVATGNITIEIRTQLTSNIWQSQTDGRYYTKGILGWWDITDNLEKYIDKQELAYEICNTVGCADNYPELYQAAYQVRYKGKMTNKSKKAISAFQTSDVRKFGFIPTDLFNLLELIK